MGFFDSTVGEVASPIASLITGAANVYMQNQNNKLTRELAQQQNQWNIEQWNRENEYNLPSNQLQRFVDAGLNPNLIYGKDSVAATSPQMVSGYDSQVAPKMEFNPQTLLYASDARLKNSQADLNEQLIENKKAEKELTDAEIKLVFKKYDLTDEQINLVRSQVESLSKQREMVDKQIEKIGAEIDVLKVDEAIKELERKFQESTFQDRVNTISEQLKKLQIDVKYAEPLAKAAVYELYARAAEHKSNAKLAESYRRKANEERKILKNQRLILQPLEGAFKTSQINYYNSLSDYYEVAKDYLPTKNISGALSDFGNLLQSVFAIVAMF